MIGPAEFITLLGGAAAGRPIAARARRRAGRNRMFNCLPNLIKLHFAARLGAACAVVVAGSHMSLAADLSKIQTIVVLYPENRSFDHLYGLFPGANGIANATKEQYIQRDHDG